MDLHARQAGGSHGRSVGPLGLKHQAGALCEVKLSGFPDTGHAINQRVALARAALRMAGLGRDEDSCAADDPGLDVARSHRGALGRQPAGLRPAASDPGDLSAREHPGVLSSQRRTMAIGLIDHVGPSRSRMVADINHRAAPSS